MGFGRLDARWLPRIDAPVLETAINSRRCYLLHLSRSLRAIVLLAVLFPLRVLLHCLLDRFLPRAALLLARRCHGVEAELDGERRIDDCGELPWLADDQQVEVQAMDNP